MKINEVLLERRIQRTRIMYHGTSSEFLPSIMKNGLIPNPPKKSYGSERPEFISLGGTYLTPKESTATYAAIDVSKMHSGDPILITVQYVERSGGLDEDIFFDDFLTIGYEYGFNYEYTNLIPYNEFQEKIIPYALKHIKPFAKPTFATQEFVQWFFKVLYQELKKISIIHLDYALPSTRREIKQRLRSNPKLRDLIIKIIEASPVKGYSEVRVSRPITFKGKTRILQIKNLNNSQILYQDQNAT